MYSPSVLVMFVDTTTVLQSSYSAHAAFQVSMDSSGCSIVTSSSGAVCFGCPGVTCHYERPGIRFRCPGVTCHNKRPGMHFR